MVVARKVRSIDSVSASAPDPPLFLRRCRRSVSRMRDVPTGHHLQGTCLKGLNVGILEVQFTSPPQQNTPLTSSMWKRSSVLPFFLPLHSRLVYGHLRYQDV